MSAVSLLRMNDEVLDKARAQEPATLRTLDALHLVAARSLGEDLSVFVAYDRQLLDAARAAGLAVASPGA
jgi:predicted nucleic acid-binding protein